MQTLGYNVHPNKHSLQLDSVRNQRHFSSTEINIPGSEWKLSMVTVLVYLLISINGFENNTVLALQNKSS